MKDSIGNLKDMQDRIVREIVVEDAVPIEDIKFVAGFSTTYEKDMITASAVVVRFPSEDIVEKKTIQRKAQMNYIPGLEAFRDGPILMELFYELEYTPDVILLKGHGIAHPQNCGIATYIGVETQVPTIGIAIKPLTEIQDEHLVMNGEIVGAVVRTREHGNPLYVSPGNNITVETSKKIIKQLTHYPHKLPEPLHLSTRMAKKGVNETKKEQQPVEEEYRSEVAR